MNKKNEKYSINKLYLNEFQFFNGEYDIIFNIVDIDTEKMTIKVAVSNLGKISVIEYDLKRDKDNNLYFEYGCQFDKISIDDFEHIEDLKEKIIENNEIKFVIGSWGSYSVCNERALGSQWLTLSNYSDWEEIEEELKREGFILNGIYKELFIQDIDGIDAKNMNCDYIHPKTLFELLSEQELYDKFEVVANKYLGLQRNLKDNFVVIIAKSPSELIHEGDFLHHCVGRMNYDQKFAREESLIFFVRNKQDIETPFVTLEYSIKIRKSCNVMPTTIRNQKIQF